MKRPYVVTSNAGFEVAGIRNPGVGQTIYLTDRQAEHPLRLREITKPAVPAEAPEPKRKDRVGETASKPEEK